MYTDERNFARSVFESDRAYQMSVQEMQMRQEEFKQNYELTQQQFEMAKEEFQVDMRMKNLSYEQALDKFKNKYAVSNSGVLGVDSTGSDIEQGYWDSWETQFGGTDDVSQSTITPGNDLSELTITPGQNHLRKRLQYSR